LFAGWSSPVARQAHNLKVVGSNPAPATNFNPAAMRGFFVNMDKPYRVYVIQNLAGRFYIGLSEDVVVRLQQHNEGVSKWTKQRGPWKLVWQSAAMTLSEARKLEIFLKRQKGGNNFYAFTGLPRRQPSGS
jgi:putative endonuclease